MTPGAVPRTADFTSFVLPVRLGLGLGLHPRNAMFSPRLRY
jgi:hypothetical protein